MCISIFSRSKPRRKNSNSLTLLCQNQEVQKNVMKVDMVDNNLKILSTIFRSPVPVSYSMPKVLQTLKHVKFITTWPTLCVFQRRSHLGTGQALSERGLKAASGGTR